MYGISLDGALPLESLRALARTAEEHGYTSLWINVERDDIDLSAALGALLEETTGIEVGVGVVPTHLYDVAAVVRQLVETGLPLHRVILGLGMGPGVGALARLSEVIERSRRLAPTLRLACGVSGVKGVRLAAVEADGLVLSWMTRPFAAGVRERLAAAAAEVGRAVPPTYLYVRAAWGPHGRALMVAATDAMRQYPRHRANLAAMGEPGFLGIVAEQAADVATGMGDYAGPWQVVLRPVLERADAAELEPLRAAVAELAPGAGGTAPRATEG